MSDTRLSRATLVRRTDCTDDLFVLWLQPEIPLRFQAGQYVTIGIGNVERAYSIVSAPCEPLVELFIERVPPEHGGTLTPLLHRLRVGDGVTMRPMAKGRLTLREQATHHVMVATVTGIAPFVSMIRQAVHDLDRRAERDQPRFFVLHGASYQDELVYDGELRRLSEERPDLVQYVPAISRPSAARNAGWRGTTGRVNEVLETQLLRWAPPQDRTVVYLCGHPQMVADAKARLQPQGWAIAEEQYWLPGSTEEQRARKFPEAP